MASKLEDWTILGVIAAIFAVLIFLDVSLVMWYAVRGFIILGAITFFVYLSNPLIQKVIEFFRKHNSTKFIANPEEIKRQKEKDRAERQKQHDRKADTYNANILRPKEERKMKRQNEEYKRLTGHQIPWSGQGNTLGKNDDSLDSGKPAPLARTLPGALQNNFPTKIKQMPKNKLFLPKEPDKDADGCINVTLRTPQGRNYCRRVLITDNVLLLLNFMTTIGYHKNLYCLSLTYPRKIISSDESLQNCDITHDITLNIEERED